MKNRKSIFLMGAFFLLGLVSANQVYASNICEEYPCGQGNVLLCHYQQEEGFYETLCLPKGEAEYYYYCPDSTDYCGPCEQEEEEYEDCEDDTGYEDAGPADAGPNDGLSDAGAADAGVPPEDAGNPPGDSPTGFLDAGYSDRFHGSGGTSSGLGEAGVRGGGCQTAEGEDGLVAILFLIAALTFGRYGNKNQVPIVLALVALPALASAQSEKQFDLDRFEPGMDENSILGSDSAEKLEPEEYVVYSWYSFSDDVLTLKDLDTGERLKTLVGSRHTVGLGFSYGLDRQADISVYLPFLHNQTEIADNGFYLGDATGKFRRAISNEEDSWLSSAFLATVTFPSSLSNDFGGFRIPTLTPSLLLSKRVGSFRSVLNAGILLAPDTQHFADIEVGSELVSSLGLAYALGEKAGEVQVNLVYAGDLSEPFENNGSLFSEARVGYQLPIGEHLTLVAGVGRGLLDGYGSPDVRGLVQVYWNGTTKTTPSPQKQETPPQPETRDDSEEEEEKILPETLRIETRPVYFAFDESTLSEANKEPLRKFVRDLTKVLEPGLHYKIRITVIGHTDYFGSEGYNEDLGQRRAEAVADFLLAEGVPSDLVEVVSMGEKSPRGDNRTRPGRAENRRVEFEIEETSMFVEIVPVKVPPTEDTYDSK